MRFQERQELADKYREWLDKTINEQQIAILDCAESLIAFLDINNYLNEVVRCKDCRYWQEYQEGHYPNELCPWDMKETTDEDDYCSYGERREDDKE